MVDLAPAPLPPPSAEPPVTATVGEDEVAWEKAKLAKNRKSLVALVHEFPESKHRHDAEILMASLSVAPVEQAKPHRERSRVP